MLYFDHSATTAVDPRVVEAMTPYWSEVYGNPSSIYGLGRRAATALEDARRRIAVLMNCAPNELVFTSCGSESNNLALRGVGAAQAMRGKRHIITSPVEHHAVLHTAEDMAERYDFDVTLLPVDRHGLVAPAEVEAAIRPDTALISIMLANNEVGTVEPVGEIGVITRRHGVPLHTDAVQAGGYLSLDVEALGVDLLSLSAHKFHGPKGVGLLYVRRGTRLQPVQTGGGQENGRRAGTENIPYIVGMARALELAQADREAEGARLTALRDQLAAGLLERIPDIHISGHPEQRLPGHLSLIVDGVEAEGMLIGLDLAGIAASSGSACATGSPTPSHVLTAMGYPPQEAMGALRLSLGRENIAEDVTMLVDILPGIVARLRAM